MSILGSLRVGSVFQIRIRQRLQRVIDEDPPPVHAQPAQSFKCHAARDISEGLHVALQGEYLAAALSLHADDLQPAVAWRKQVQSHIGRQARKGTPGTLAVAALVQPRREAANTPIPDCRLNPRAARSLPLRRFPTSGAGGLGAQPPP